MKREKVNRTMKLVVIGNLPVPRIVCLRASTPYVTGSRYTNIESHEGRFSIGKRAPDKKNNGYATKLTTRLNPSGLSMTEPIVRPMLTIPRDKKKIITRAMGTFFIPSG